MIRALLYVAAAERKLDQRCAHALNLLRPQLRHLSLAEFKTLVRDQACVLHFDPEHAVEALAVLVPERDARNNLLTQLRAIVGAGDPPAAAESERLARLSRLLAIPMETAATSG